METKAKAEQIENDHAGVAGGKRGVQYMDDRMNSLKRRVGVGERDELGRRGVRKRISCKTWAQDDGHGRGKIEAGVLFIK
ncbi:hypothetical protein AMTR_s00006p00263280 [Amborella trichopoda]|uniref:Uncharacterized protein n=1 Tax=Amborella trichopoda TaxID=13333 RepID=W1PDR6_AMBTC|nr:hypothetical protein AMTR_s00006p00263280 [Amborella trichopoda]